MTSDCLRFFRVMRAAFNVSVTAFAAVSLLSVEEFIESKLDSTTENERGIVSRTVPSQFGLSHFYPSSIKSPSSVKLLKSDLYTIVSDETRRDERFLFEAKDERTGSIHWCSSVAEEFPWSSEPVTWSTVASIGS